MHQFWQIYNIYYNVTSSYVFHYLILSSDLKATSKVFHLFFIFLHWLNLIKFIYHYWHCSQTKEAIKLWNKWVLLFIHQKQRWYQYFPRWLGTIYKAGKENEYTLITTKTKVSPFSQVQWYRLPFTGNNRKPSHINYASLRESDKRLFVRYCCFHCPNFRVNSSFQKWIYSYFLWFHYRKVHYFFPSLTGYISFFRLSHFLVCFSLNIFLLNFLGKYIFFNF